ncbi:nucleic acid-binding domain protein [Ancylostoma caninum]|uniref:Nucleic acid-binding domain protein n=1 Tax=Ancylostoma caninum TaxID=29170 RepID=A0A368GW96_ANCCA|nr:nucleic acid-binding domain protein [Ancylostoma caninum]
MSPKKQKEPRYNYTSLRDLPDSGRVYVYGVVTSVSDTDFGGPIIEIQDENGSAVVKVKKESSRYFFTLQVNDILRLHRAEIVPHGDGLALLMDVNNAGCHAVSWRGDSHKPHITTSKTYTVTDNDRARIASLRKLIHAENADEVVDNAVHEVREAAENQLCENAQVEAAAIPSAEKKAEQIKKRRSAEDVPNAMDIPRLGSRFFNFYAQVLGVYKGKGEPFVVFIRVWDGTRPRFPVYRNMFRADAESIGTTYCEISPTLYCVIEPFTIDICCYGDWAKKAATLQLGDVIHLCNIRNYTSQSNGFSAVTMHEGGIQFGRALEVLDEKDPKHFEISKQCADSLSRNFGPSFALQCSSSAVDLTPIVPENIVAQSTPVLSQDNCTMVAKDEQGNDQSSQEQVEELAPDTPPTSVVPPRGSGGVLVEVSTNVSIVGDTPNEEVDAMSTRKTPRRKAAEKLNKISPSTKRRCEREAAASAVVIREQGTIETTGESREPAGAMDISLPSTSKQSEQRSVPAEKASPERRRSKRTPVNEPPTPRKHVFVSLKRPSERNIEDPEAIIEESPEEQVADVSTEEYTEEAKFEAALNGQDAVEDTAVDDSGLAERFAKKLRKVFFKFEFENCLAELRRPEVFSYSLTEEIEHILRLEVGNRVCIANFVEPCVEILKEPDYLRKALVFTAVCVVCGDEVIVDKGSKIWCTKCFIERKQLAQVLYSYRITVPVAYERSDGSAAQLLMEVAREEWAAFPTSDDLFSRGGVLELFLQSDLRKFAVQLNHMIRFAEAVMKRRKISVIDAKIYDLCREDGSLTLFVDKCVFALRGG